MRRKFKFLKSSNFWLSFSAVAIALVSLIFTIAHSIKNREHDVSSTTPYMAVGFWHKPDILGIDLTNSGLGPARLEWFQVSVDGKPQNSWSKLLENLGFMSIPSHEYSVPYSHKWWKPNETVSIFKIEGKANVDKLKRDSIRINFSYCYESTYGRYYLINKNSPKPQVLKNCEPKPNVTLGPSPLFCNNQRSGGESSDIIRNGVWQFQKKSVWIKINAKNETFQCRIDKDGQIFKSLGLLRNGNEIHWDKIWGIDQITFDGNSIILKGKNGTFLYTPANCNINEKCECPI